MPFVNVSSSTGKTRFRYTISTPSSASAEAIQPGLPVLFFFHALALHHVFHTQFSDRKLRKFNLVTFDLRWHGETKSDTVPPVYGQEEAAEDVIALINALQLPPCHFVALDMGTTIALQIAVKIPEQVLSLFLMSHICLDELPEIFEGRTELFQLYTSGLPDSDNDVANGFVQYTFSKDMSNLACALHYSSIVTDLSNWSPEHHDEYRLISYEFFRIRKPHSRESLSRISCPVKLLQGGRSLIYPPSYTEELMRNLREAGVNATMEIIPDAPHYLCVDFGQEVNPMIHDLVVESLHNRNVMVPPTPIETVVSPWDRMLRDHGWDPMKKHALDDDDLVISYPTRESSLEQAGIHQGWTNEMLCSWL
ncbi:Alpha/Beta hydrolase protein [Lentinula raphanica]|nr:Alpha/Beta hydrolase protein [Lentinula raphanica]